MLFVLKIAFQKNLHLVPFINFSVDSARSSHQRCSVRKGVLRNFTKFSGKHLCQSLFLLKKRLRHRCFPVSFVKFPRTPFLQNTSGRLLLLCNESYPGKCARHLHVRIGEYIGISLLTKKKVKPKGSAVSDRFLLCKHSPSF